MSNKPKKKRNKQYTGVDAAVTKPSVTKLTAANRSKFGQWWFEHKRIARPVIIASGVALLIIILIVQLIHITTN